MNELTERQERVAHFATLVALGWGGLSLGSMLAVAPLVSFTAWTAVISSGPALLMFVAIAAVGVIAMLVRNPGLSAWAGTFDVSLVVLPVASTALAIGWEAETRAGGDLLVAMVATLVALVRVLSVSSGAWRTAALTALAFAPVLALAARLGEGLLSHGLWALMILGVSVYGVRAGPRSDERRERSSSSDGPRRVGPYELEDELGSGGMGIVFRARHRDDGRRLAVKLLRASAHEAVALERFEREVVQTRRLAHPNTIAVRDFGRTPDGSLYYAMELIDGLDLQELVRTSGPLPPRRVVHILAQVCASLAEAHDLKLVHRDVKPANIMLCRRGEESDFVKVLDFGLVRDLTCQGSLTAKHFILGTPDYCSPEMVMDGTAVGPESDLYAVGCVAYFLLTGRPPFIGDSVIDVCRQHLYEKPIPPVAFADMGDALDELVLQCLAKSPNARPASARALASALLACV